MEIIALIIAGYGAVLSTVLAYREYRKDRRNVRIFLEYIAFRNTAQVVVVNAGPKPVTITDLQMALGINGDWDPVPHTCIDVSNLPATLSDGEFVSIQLSGIVPSSMLSHDFRAKITVFDAEGNQYSDFEQRTHNPKWGGYSPRQKLSGS